MINWRSLTFQLVGWYAAALLALTALFGAGAFVVTRHYLVRSLRERQVIRARLICESIERWTKEEQGLDWGSRIERAFTPRAINRLVRIRKGDTVLYDSGPYVSLKASREGVGEEAVLFPNLSLVRDRIISVTRTAQDARGEIYTVECGAPNQSVEAALQEVTLSVLLCTPLVVAVALAGGYFLVKRSLSPVIAIAEKAGRISVENLSERLPVPRTADELEHLSKSLNSLLHRLDESLQHSRRFMADASHELRTPLTILQSGMEALVDERVPQSEAKGVMMDLLEETERLTKIVEALFALSRLDAGEGQRECVAVDLGTLVKTTTEQMSLLADDKKISATCITQQGVTVLGDRSRLKQVIVNLLDNAIKYTPEYGSVSLRVVAENSHAIVEVTDTGIGIPPEALPRLFSRFFRVDKARSRNLGGAGLGLAIAKSICAAHGGDIAVQSGPGKGTSFRVSLPLHSRVDSSRVETSDANALPLSAKGRT